MVRGLALFLRRSLSATLVLNISETNIAATIIIVVILRPWGWDSGAYLLQNAVAKLFFANL